MFNFGAFKYSTLGGSVHLHTLNAFEAEHSRAEGRSSDDLVSRNILSGIRAE